MEMKVLWAGALFFAGWLWFFLFVRQFVFNFTIAFPLISRMRNTAEDLIHKSAVRYTVISVIACAVFIAIVLFVIFRFCARICSDSAAGSEVGHERRHLAPIGERYL